MQGSLMWDVFISHASEDKDSVARPLAGALRSFGLRVWYDEFSLGIGDSLRRSIDAGLAQSDFGIVILSHDFFKKEWAQAELDGLIARQRKGRKVVLPVWHGLSTDELRQYSPTLADLVAVDTRVGISETAKRLFAAICDERVGQTPHVQMDQNNLDKSHSVVAAYTQALIAEIQNNLVLELYEKSHYEDLCITPLVQAVDPLGRFADVHDVCQVVSIGRCAILGDPGSGKTTALRLLALDLLRRSPLLEIPVYLPLAAFEHSASKMPLSFSDFIDTEISLLGCESLERLASAAHAEPVLLLDGWDEVGEESQQSIKRYLNRNEIRFVVTTRPEAQRTLPSVDRFEMYPLTVERMREFIKLRIKDAKQSDDLLSWISGSPQMLDLARNPLNLSILGIVFLEEGEVSRLTKTKLFERAFQAILEQHHKVHLHPYQNSFIEGDDLSLRIDDILGALAYQTVRHGDGRFFSVRELRLACVGILDKVPGDFHAILAGRLGIIRDRRSGRFEFFHAWYQEFLAARYIVNTGKNTVAEFEHPKLASSLAFAVGLLDSADDARGLLEQVSIQDVFNYCRAISEGAFSERDIEKLLDRAIVFGENHQPRLPVRVELARALANAGPGAIRALTQICKSEARSVELYRLLGEKRLHAHSFEKL
jgi:hypothetical protein